MLVLLTACARGQISVVYTEHSGTADPSLPIAILPYDRDAALAHAAAVVRPPTVSAQAQGLLDSIPARFASLLARDGAWTVLRDSTELLARQLESLARSSEPYRRLYARFSDVSRRAQRAGRNLEADRQAVDGARETLDPALERYRAAVRTWGSRVAKVYEDAIVAAMLAARRDAVIDTLTSGELTTRLRPGRWWLYARAPDSRNPYGELYWNVRIDVAEGRLTTVSLSDSNARRRLRFSP